MTLEITKVSVSWCNACGCASTVYCALIAHNLLYSNLQSHINRNRLLMRWPTHDIICNPSPPPPVILYCSLLYHVFSYRTLLLPRRHNGNEGNIAKIYSYLTFDPCLWKLVTNFDYIWWHCYASGKLLTVLHFIQCFTLTTLF